MKINKSVSCLSVAWLLVSAIGCTDHRMSLAKFLELTEVRHSAALAASIAGEYPINPDEYLGAFVVGEGDVLAVIVSGTELEAPMPAFQVRVDRAGVIDLPGVGSVNILHKELQDVEQIIRGAYVPQYFQDVSVHVDMIEADTTNVTVVGAVSEPGIVPLRRHQRNLLFAIVGSGGASDAASGLATLRRIRKPEEDATYDMRDPFQVRLALALEPLEDGDIVFVHAAPPNTIFVGGLVGVVGPQNYPPGAQITILQAIAGAGGLRTDVFPREGTLIRSVPHDEDLHVKLDIKRLTTGLDPNIALNAGDILWVPHTWDTRLEEWVSRNVFFRAGMTVTYNVTGREYLNRPRQQNRDFGDSGGVESFVDPLGFLVPTP